jgi:membrane-bound serine protease (ClpP class)
VNGRTVKTAAGERVLHTSGAPVQRFDMGVIDRFLTILVNPNLAYILMVVGIFGIIFELSAPGIGAPGIAGGIAILLSMVGFGSLPTNIGGVIFIVLAVVLFIVDIKVPSHGIWTAGGIVSFVLGSLLLFPPWRPPAFPSAPEIRISPVTIVVMTSLTSLFFIFVISKGIAAHARRVSFGSETLSGAQGEAVTDLDTEGTIRVAGEVWSASSAEGRIGKGEAVVVTGRDGLRLTVRRKNSADKESQGGT